MHMLFSTVKKNRLTCSDIYDSNNWDHLIFNQAECYKILLFTILKSITNSSFLGRIKGHVEARSGGGVRV